MKGALQSAKPPLRRQTLDRFDVTALAAHSERNAGWHGFAVDQDRAGAALAAIATGLHAGEMRDVAQIVDQQVALERS